MKYGNDEQLNGILNPDKHSPSSLKRKALFLLFDQQEHKEQLRRSNHQQEPHSSFSLRVHS